MSKSDKKSHHPNNKFQQLPKQQEDFIRFFYIEELTRNPYRSMRAIYAIATTVLEGYFMEGFLRGSREGTDNDVHKGKLCKCCSIPSYEWFSNSRSKKSMWGMWSAFNNWYEQPFTRSFISKASYPSNNDSQKDLKTKVALTIESALDDVKLAMQELRADGKAVSVRLAYNIAIQSKMYPVSDDDTIWEIINSAQAYTQEELIHERFKDQKRKGSFDTFELDEKYMMYSEYDNIVSHSDGENYNVILQQLDFYSGATDYDAEVFPAPNTTWVGFHNQFKKKFNQESTVPTHFDFMISIVVMEMTQQSDKFRELFGTDEDDNGWVKSSDIMVELEQFISRVNKILDGDDRILFKSTLRAVLKYLKEKEGLDYYPIEQRWTSLFQSNTYMAKWGGNSFDRLVEIVLEVTEILVQKPSLERNVSLIDLLDIPHKKELLSEGV